jgi:hypothetical protein
VPERLRIVVDHLADEHVMLLRLVDGDKEGATDEEEIKGMRAIAKRGKHVWLVTHETANPPVHAQVLDLSIGRLYPPHPYETVRRAGEWEKLPFGGKNVDVDRILVGIEVMPSQQDVLDGFSMTPAISA